MRRNEITTLCVATVLLVLVFVVLGLFGVLELSNKIDTSQLIQIIITFVLVLVTVAYVKRTADIANATKEQADASVKIAEEMREQRIAESRPFMIPKAMPTEINGTPTDVFSHFAVYNEGKGPAIEVQVSLLDKEKKPIRALRDTSVGVGRPPYEGSHSGQMFPFELTNLSESTYYIVCEYQSIFFRLFKKQTWYQTWLPFQRCQSSLGGVRVEPSELEFTEVCENERVDAVTKLRLLQTGVKKR